MRNTPFSFLVIFTDTVMEGVIKMSNLDKATYRNILKLAKETKFISEATYEEELKKLESDEEI